MTSIRRGSAARGCSSAWSDSRTSTALPAVRPSTWSMSVISASQASPFPRATCTIARASSTLFSRLGMNAPEPALTSITSASSPAASFFDRIEATISGIDSTVAGRVAQRVEAAVGRRQLRRLADDRAAGLADHAAQPLEVRRGVVAGDRVELVERAAGVAEPAAGDHRHAGRRRPRRSAPAAARPCRRRRRSSACRAPARRPTRARCRSASSRRSARRARRRRGRGRRPPSRTPRPGRR